MKVIVFGSTGTIGNHLIEQALEKGYQVTAFCRNKAKLDKYNHLNLKIIEGNVFNKRDVLMAIEGQEMVIIALGSGKKRKSTVRSEGTKNIIEAMKQTGVKRLICQTTLGAGDSMGNLNFYWKYLMFGWFLKQVFQDHELQEDYVRNSGLEWTIVRPGAFINGKKTENYRHGFETTDKSVKLKISRADVADFILKQTDSSRYLFQSP